MLTHELKDYIVFRDNRSGQVFQMHKNGLSEGIVRIPRQVITVLARGLTQEEAIRFAGLTKEE